tara:strand:+ start:155 stop:772 length:618 start_codon:yes stop_codon:yes gene_type:complete
MSSLMKAKAYNGGLVVVNMDMLQKNERLVGATIFNRLFCLEDDDENEWGPNKLNVDKDGHLTILNDYEITSKEWFNFTNFLQLGITDHYIVAYTPGLTQSEAYKKLFLQSLNRFYFEGVPAKFGPIPALDEFYESIKNIEEEKKINRNPLSPSEDNGLLFNWDINLNFGSPIKLNKDLPDEYKWSYMNNASDPNVTVWRQKKKLS